MSAAVSPPPAAARDRRFMDAALRLGRRGMGRTWPNPAVGCLIVREENAGAVIVGRGWTLPGGRPHAETVALGEAGAQARGATAYVTLEPCSHHGHTPPCAQALVAAGVSRVVVACDDPDPRVAGRGYDILRAAGIVVVTGVCAQAARRDHAGHILRVTCGRPHIELKLAHSRDGFIAGPGHQPVRITGDITDGWVHRMRAQSDAILVGAGTVASDDPLLTCRLPGARELSPVRVIVDARLATLPQARLVRTARDVPTWIVCCAGAAPERHDALAREGVEIIEVEVAPDGHVDIVAAVRALATRGITRLMVEGGATIARAFVEHDLVDTLVLIEGACDIGAGGLLTFAADGPDFALRDGRFAAAGTMRLGPDQLQRFVRENG